MKEIIEGILMIALFMIAAILCFNGIHGWGWFLFVAIVLALDYFD